MSFFLATASTKTTPTLFPEEIVVVMHWGLKVCSKTHGWNTTLPWIFLSIPRFPRLSPVGLFLKVPHEVVYPVLEPDQVFFYFVFYPALFLRALREYVPPIVNVPIELVA
ncbi:MAG: hypothetical protein HY975_02120 [Candidatus Kerfeldbacteria bacterium]|nr:hypothetical protein [Candidatus Kerfeldbacteria bacterium]